MFTSRIARQEKEKQTNLAIVKVKQYEACKWPQAERNAEKVSRNEWLVTYASWSRKQKMSQNSDRADLQSLWKQMLLAKFLFI